MVKIEFNSAFDFCNYLKETKKVILKELIDYLGRIKSENITALIDKIEHSFNERGYTNPKDVYIMLYRIITKGVKKQSLKGWNTCPPDGQGDEYDRSSKFLGYGHFKFNHKMYILNEEELKLIKDYMIKSGNFNSVKNFKNG